MSSKLTKQQREELKALEAMSDEDIDYSDIPPIDEAEWRQHAVRGKFYRPIKRPVTIRLDADVVAWFKAQNGKYQTRINEALREYMENHQQR